MASLTEIKGISSSLAAACVKNNFRTIAKIAAAKPSELSVVPGISEKGAHAIIASAQSLLPRPRVTKPIAKKKPRVVAPVKVDKKPVAAKPTKASTEKTKEKSKPKSSEKSATKEKKMAAVKTKDKIKKLKKKIKKLKTEKKKILAKEKSKSKKLKKKK